LNLVASSGPAQLSGLSCNPATLGTGQTTTCTLTLTSVPTGTAIVNVSSSSGLLPVPSTVGINGSTTGMFVATVGTITSSSSMTIMASYNGQVKVATINLNASVVSGVVCTPATVNAPGTSACTVTLTAAAPGGGLLVSLSSNNASATVPANVTVGAGASTAGFTATVSSVSTDQSALITASGGGQSQSFTLNLVASSGSAQLSGLSCNPATLGTGQTTTCTLTLTSTPTGTAMVNLNSSSGLLPVPAGLNINGSATGTFTATAGTISSNASATITASYGGQTKTATVSLTSSPGTDPQISALTCSPTSLRMSEVANCVVTMNMPVTAPTDVSLSPSDTVLNTPSSVTVGSGLTTATFVVTAGTTSTDKVVTLTASALSGHVQTSITIQPPLGPNLSVPAYLGATVSSLVAFKAFVNDPNNLSVSLSASALPPGAAFSSNGLFNWTPGDDQLGSHSMTITATNSANVTASKKITVNVIPSTPSVTAVKNAASFTQGDVCSPGSWVSVLGAGFTRQAPVSLVTDPLASTLGGLQVLVNGSPAPLLYASDSFINLQCPQVAAGSQLQITVSAETGSSTNPVFMTMRSATPGLFTMDASGSGQGAVLIAGTNQIAMPQTDGLPSRPAVKGEYLSIYGNGFGDVDGGVPPGSPAPLDRLLYVKYPVRAFVGGIEVVPSFAGLTPGQYSLFVVNVQIPAGVAAGPAVPVYLTVTLDDGTVLTTNQVTVAIADLPPAQ
jgi:uncharacterized protein (TIGR03437 family)